MPTSALTEVVSYAPLDVVGTENYIRYGQTGPLRYVFGTPPDHTIPRMLEVYIEIQTPAQTFILENLQLQQLHHQTLVRTTWHGDYAPYQVQMRWIWDFYRMLSCLQLKMVSSLTDYANTNALEFWKVMDKMPIGTEIRLSASPKSGDIVQRHILEAVTGKTPNV